MMSWSTHDQNGKEKENEIGIGRVHRLWERKTLKTMEVQIIQKEYVIRKRARMNKEETNYQKEKREIEKERKKRDGKDKEKREMEKKERENVVSIVQVTNVMRMVTRGMHPLLFLRSPSPFFFGKTEIKKNETRKNEFS